MLNESEKDTALKECFDWHMRTLGRVPSVKELWDWLASPDEEAEW